MDYILYHDESKQKGYWHGMLLVPTTKKEELLSLLFKVRENFKYKYPISFKNIRDKKSRLKVEFAEAWIQIAVASLMSSTKNKPYGVFLGNKENHRREYAPFKNAIGCKFILFRERDTLDTMEYYTDPGSKVEITFRMGVKGGLHYVAGNAGLISISRIHLDGHKHIHRRYSRQRIVDRIRGLKEYCSFDPRADLIVDDSSDHRRDDSQPYDDCQLLQLTDLLVGSFRTVLRGSEKTIHHKISAPVRSILERYSNQFIWNNSRWKNSLAISQCYLENRKWVFETIEIEPEFDDVQIPLPIFDLN